MKYKCYKCKHENDVKISEPDLVIEMITPQSQKRRIRKMHVSCEKCGTNNIIEVLK